MRKWQYGLISRWKRCFVQTRALCWKKLKLLARSPIMIKRADVMLKTLFCTNLCALLKNLRSGVHSAKITKRDDLGLIPLFWTISWTLLKEAKTCWTQCENEETCWSRAQNALLCKLVNFAEKTEKVVYPVQKWQYVLISGWKRWFGQIEVLFWKSLKSGVLSAKMKKRAQLGLKTLFCTNSCTLQEIAKKWCTQCQNDKTCRSRSEKIVLYKVVHFDVNAKKWCPSAKMTKRPDLGLNMLFCTNGCALLKSAKKWSAQCENLKTWCPAENAENAKKWCVQGSCTLWKSLISGGHSPKIIKHADLGLITLFWTNSSTRLKVVRLVRKWGNVLIWGRKRCFGQTNALCWKSLKSCAPSAKMLQRADLRLKTLFCTNSCTLLKTLRSGVTQSENDKTCWSRAENAVLYKLVHFAENG